MANDWSFNPAFHSCFLALLILDWTRLILPSTCILREFRQTPTAAIVMSRQAATIVPGTSRRRSQYVAKACQECRRRRAKVRFPCPGSNFAALSDFLTDAALWVLSEATMFSPDTL